jgi:hypothetical protein
MAPSSDAAGISCRFVTPPWQVAVCISWGGPATLIARCRPTAHKGRQTSHDWASRNAASVATAPARARARGAAPREPAPRARIDRMER